jgi:myo-inositol 2-dehydrogenase/D-chiro-inositol 1-dehydrogenase
MIGAGSISDYHIAGLQEAGAEIVVIFSRTEAKAREKAQHFKIPHYTTDYQEILDRDDVEAVVIATPDFTHEGFAAGAAKAGKAILLQKPMARTSQECSHIIEATEEAGVPLYVSWMHRYFEEVLKVQELLAEGVLGQVYLIRQRNATPGAGWASWFYSKENVGGGVVLQLGVHGIDLLRTLFGEIEAVKATTALMKKERTLADGSVVRPDNEDTAIAIYRLASGAIAVHEIAYNEVAGTDRFRMEIYGERGTAWLRTEKGLLSLYAPAYLGQEGWSELQLPTTPFGWRQHHHFLAMLRGEEQPDSSAHDGLVANIVAEAIYRSADSGDWEQVTGCEQTTE